MTAVGVVTGGVGGGAGLLGGSTVCACPSRAKKKMFNAKDVRKKLKGLKLPQCEECKREKLRGDNKDKEAKEESEKSDRDEPLSLSVCVTCATVCCARHAKSHFGAPRSSDPHQFIAKIDAAVIICEACSHEVCPLEESSAGADPVKAFVNEYREMIKVNASRFTSSKRVSADGEKEANGVKVEGKPNGTNGTGEEKENGDGERQAGGGKKDKETRKEEKRRFRESGVGTAGDMLLPAKGLPNLGNTCFFNSVMQSIMHTHHLQYYFERFGRKKELVFDEDRVMTINEHKVEVKAARVAVPQDGTPMNDALKYLLGEFRSQISPNPSSLFSHIAKKAPRFRGWAQQDAHELLRYLLDGLRSEEADRYKAGIAGLLGVSVRPSKEPRHPDVVRRAKGYLEYAGRPLLDAVFGGTLLQTIRCCECQHVSERYEQMLDLSVPVTTGSIRAAAGGSASSAPSRPSAYQKKKEAKEKKKNARLATRKAAVDATRKGGGQEEEEEEEEGQAEENGVCSGVDALTLAESESDELASDGEKECGSRDDAGADPLDYTKALVPAPAGYSHERTVTASLLEFTQEERLAGANAYECEKCCTPRNKKENAKGAGKKRVEALKRYLVFKPPAVLTMHLKRFQQTSSLGGRLSTRKLGGHVAFPLLLDIAPFCCKNVERVSVGQKRVVYSLYGVVVHSGDLSGGHYIAYVKSRTRLEQAHRFLEAARLDCVDALGELATDKVEELEGEAASPDGQWYYASDSRVNMVSEAQVLKAEAYILFYERVL